LGEPVPKFARYGIRVPAGSHNHACITCKEPRPASIKTEDWKSRGEGLKYGERRVFAQARGDEHVGRRHELLYLFARAPSEKGHPVVESKIGGLLAKTHLVRPGSGEDELPFGRVDQRS
jgi:hypothetical protein